jgi:hypothetical protein
MRWTVLGLLCAACNGEPVCGLDERGEERPVCEYTEPKVPEPFQYCPGDSWSTSECKSCACDNDGNVLCTDVLTDACAETST